MGLNLEKLYRKRTRLTAVLLAASAIVSIVFLTIAIEKHVLANRLEKENKDLKSQIKLLKKENSALK